MGAVQKRELRDRRLRWEKVFAEGDFLIDSHFIFEDGEVCVKSALHINVHIL